MLTVFLLLLWVRHRWNWLNFIRPIPRRIEEDNDHAEGIHLHQPISQECGAGEEATTAEGNREVGEVEVETEAMTELQRSNAELTHQLEKRKKDKEYYNWSRRQTSQQIDKLVQQKLGLEDQVNLLQHDNSDLRKKLQEANSRTIGNIPQVGTVADGSRSNRGWGYHPSDATSVPSGTVSNIDEEPTEINGWAKMNKEMKLDKASGGNVGSPVCHRRSASLVTRFNVELRNENAELKSDRKDLGDAVVSLNNENENLRYKCKKMNGSNKKLISFNKELIVENKELDNHCESLTGKNEVLSAENEALLKENDSLEEKNKSLVAEKENLVIENNDLTEERKDLVAKNQALKKENRILVRDKSTLAAHNQTLTVENEALLHEKETLTAQKETLTADRERLAERNGMMTEEDGNRDGKSRQGSPSRAREKFGK